MKNRYTVSQVIAVLAVFGFEPTSNGGFTRSSGSISNGQRITITYITRTDKYMCDNHAWGQDVNGDEWETRDKTMMNAQDLLHTII